MWNAWLLAAATSGLLCAQTGIISTYAGTGNPGYSGDNGPATSATLFNPIGMGVDSSGNLFIADTQNSVIRRVDAGTGVITTVAGGGTGGDGGPALAAQLFNPCGVKVDASGNLFISESCITAAGGSGGGGGGGGSMVNRIRHVDAATGIITTIAGGFNFGFSGDGGPAVNALLNTPGQVALDAAGDIFVADYGNNRIRRIDGASGVITTIAGNGTTGYAGDGGPATSASLNGPASVAVDSAGNLYIADTLNNAIRRVDAVTGNISTVAGTGNPTFNGDGIAATSANIGAPVDVILNAAGNLVIADNLNNRVRMVDLTTGLIWTLAGNGSIPSCCGNGDGQQATMAELNLPAGLAFSPSGPLYIAELRANDVRKDALPSSLASTAVTLTADQTSVGAGSTLTLTGTLSANTGSVASATGYVYFVDASAGFLGSAPVTNGSAVFSISTLSLGQHQIEAGYTADANFGASLSPAITITVTNQQPSSVALAASPNPASPGQPVTLTATVSPSSATGTITFFNGGTTLGTASLSGGAAVLPNLSFSAGTYSLTAQYGGDANDTSSTSTVVTLVAKALTSVAVSSSANPSGPGQAVTFTANVTPSAATGTVQFLDGAAVIGTASVASGAAAVSTSSLAGGSHSITASYSGDTNYAPSTSPAISQNVQNTTSVSLGTNAPNPVPNQVSTFTAYVSPSTATGTVQFLDGGSVLGTGTIASGSASFSATLAPGSHSMTAAYTGDASDAASTSSVLTVVVKTPINSLTFVSNLNPSVVGQTVTFTATIDPSAATGTVQFLDNGTVLATATLSNGVAIFSTSTLAQGTHPISPSYSGDSTYLSAASSAVNQVVNAKTPTTTAVSSSENPAYANSLVTFTASVSPSAATGTVQFLDGANALGASTLANGVAQLSVSSLGQGTHSITAVYGGDATNAASTSAVLSQAMKLGAGLVMGINPSPAVTGQTVAITANMTSAATGTVQFTDGATVLANVPVSNGVASYSTSTLTAGVHTLGIAYSGDSTYFSQSNSFNETVLAATTTALGSSANPSTVGQSVTFTATVSPSNATGSVQFFDGSTLLATVALSGGSAAVTTSSLAQGSHSISAAYSGDATHAQSYSAVLTEIRKVNTTTSVGSGSNPSSSGQSVTFTATVSPSAATGSVQFFDGSTLLGTSMLSGGSAAFSTASLAAGLHSISAVYGGDTYSNSSSSAVLTQSVLIATTVSLTSSKNPARSRDTVAYTATISPSSSAGTVQFFDGGTLLGTVTVAGGKAGFSQRDPADGTHSIQAVYSGDTTHSGSSATLSEVVNH